ncbi:membrane associated rhomboid family serine protease [Dysgonomonas alginatilytica]|uniref:Membrane associated rhomboid family serine protease n=1 Tax=Dysgonomonas alginatilytica TaxID=1605892 RepID=A0A2V3PZ79_9BACT|nr:rhomboid family intramembrane serine protease [Dysgonomonas alginatilytica]PXV67461.1 membrane associated rhomboid family serine protease [Dysgonomonas alginatilytica]
MNQSRGGMFASVPPVTLNIIIINVLFWLVQVVFANKGIDISTYLGLHYFKSDLFYPHQLFTYMFLHDPSGITHVFFNMFAVFMFGRTLEMIWGGKRFLFYYITTGIGAALFNMLVVYIRINSAESALSPDILAEIYKNGAELISTGRNYADPLLGNFNALLNQTMVGASGAVFGILVAFGMLFPNVELMLLFFPVPIKAKYFVILYGIMELFMGVWDRAGDNVAHFAHLGGLLTGFILVLYWRRNNKRDGKFY